MSAKNPRIITFGAALQDVFMYGPSLHAHRGPGGHGYVEQFPLGAKIEVENVYFDIGGGATNAAVTFARQGFDTEYIGKVGRDSAGGEVVRVLKREGVETGRVAVDKTHNTGHSTILLAPTGERTVLAHRGASDYLTSDDIAVRKLDADWFYITSLAGNLDLLGKLLRHANNHGIRVAFDPGSKELAQARKLRAMLPLVTVIKGNVSEMRALFGVIDIKDVLRAAADTCRVALVTNGPSGSYAAIEDRMYRAGVYKKAKSVDRTGAGDAFGSGFVAGLARGYCMEDALTLGAANASGVILKMGAKQGILKGGRVRRMKIETFGL